MAISFFKRVSLLMQKFPLEIIVHYNYSNVCLPRSYKGIYLKESKKLDGGRVDTYHFFFKRGFMKYEEIPDVSLNNLEVVGNSRVLQVFKLDEGLFMPLKTVKDLVFENDEPVFDEKGEPVLNDRGVQQTERVQRVFKYTTRVLTKNGVYEIPTMFPQQNYANRVWNQLSHVMATNRYASQGWWEKYGAFVIIFVMFLGTALIIKFNYDGFNAGLQQVTSAAMSIAESNKELAKALVEVAGKK